jgi:hypothetical protein
MNKIRFLVGALIAAAAISAGFNSTWAAPEDMPTTTYVACEDLPEGDITSACYQPPGPCYETDEFDEPSCPTPPTVDPPPLTFPPEVCFQHLVPGPDLAEGEFELVDSIDEATGSTSRGIMLCRPIVEVAEPPAPRTPSAAPELPATGDGYWNAALLAAAFVAAGFAVLWAARR